MKSEQVLVKDLAKGDKFYYYDHLIYEVLGLTIFHKDNNRVELKVRQYKTKIESTIGMSGQDVAVRPIYRYTGRDSSSFHAGFRMAMEICIEHMGVFDKENAEIENDFQRHMKGIEAYKEWMTNNFVDKCNFY